LTLLADIASNEIATATRWQKLYRTIFNSFLKVDFVHIKDFKKFETDLNTRLTQIEANFNKEVVVLKADVTSSILGHLHINPQAPAGSLPSGPGIPTKPPTPSVPSATPLLAVVDTFAQAQDAKQQALGPSAAPLGQGTSPEVIAARIDVKSDIGLT
jgi:hypothetical protein